MLSSPQGVWETLKLPGWLPGRLPAHWPKQQVGQHCGLSCLFLHDTLLDEMGHRAAEDAIRDVSSRVQCHAGPSILSCAIASGRTAVQEKPPGHPANLQHESFGEDHIAAIRPLPAAKCSERRDINPLLQRQGVWELGQEGLLGCCFPLSPLMAAPLLPQHWTSPCHWDSDTLLTSARKLGFLFCWHCIKDGSRGNQKYPYRWCQEATACQSAGTCREHWGRRTSREDPPGTPSQLQAFTMILFPPRLFQM